MKRFLIFAACLAGCAAVPDSPEMAVIDRVNFVVNQRPPCDSTKANVCHEVYPSRAELYFAQKLECTGYVMAKAYLLLVLGFNPERLEIAELDMVTVRHAVLVVDHALALDNLTPLLEPISMYEKFKPIFYPVPWKP